MIGKLKDMMRGMDGEWVISFTTRDNPVQTFHRMKDYEVDIEIQKARKARSKDANRFCWALCTMIGNALRPPVPKEEVYRKAIRDVGEYVPLPIKAEAVETFITRWASNGVGWFAEVMDNSKIPGYKLIFAYYGSSTYDTAAMSRVIDYLVDDAEQMKLPVPARKEQEEMLKAWRGA